MGIVKGVNDLEYFYAGRTHFIELKSREGIQSEDQKLFQSRVFAQAVAIGLIGFIRTIGRLITQARFARHRGSDTSQMGLCASFTANRVSAVNSPQRKECRELCASPTMP
jgi:hypothetical protein